MVEITDLATAKFVIEMVLATLLAMGIWLITPPRTFWKDLPSFLEDLIAKFIAVFAAALVFIEGGQDIYSITGFIAIVSAGVTGVGIASWVLSKTATPPSSPGPPATP